MRRLKRTLGGYLAKETRMLTKGVPMRDNARPHRAAANIHSLDLFIHSFDHSVGMCRMQQFLAVLRIFFHSCLLYTLSFHSLTPTSLPSSLTSSCHLQWNRDLSFLKGTEKTNDECGKTINPNTWCFQVLRSPNLF